MDAMTAVANWSDATKKTVLAEQDSRVGTACGTDLVRRLNDVDYLKRLWQGLNGLERQAALLLLREAPGGYMSRRDWEQAAAGVHPHLSAGLNGLRRLGLVLSGRKGWSESGYLMPSDVRDHLFALLIGPASAEPSPAPGPKPVLTYCIPSGRGIHLEMIACLLALREGMPLTRKGTPHAQALRQLASRMSLSAEHAACLSRRIGKHESRWIAPMIVLDLALRLGLARTEQGRLTLDEGGLACWMALSGDERFDRLFRLVRTCYLPAEPWLEALFACLRHSFHTGWNSLPELLDRLRQAGFRLPENALLAAREWLHLLLGFGWIQLGEDEDGTLRWQWHASAMEQEGAAWYVEPTGLILLPPSVPLPRLWELERIAEILFDGEWLKAELSASRIQRCVNQGSSVEEVLSFLASGSGAPIPPQLADTVSEWARQAGQIRLETVVRVRAANPRLMDELRAMPGMQPYLAEVISPTDFLVPLERREELSAFLRRCGYEPQCGWEGRFRPLGEPVADAPNGRTAEAEGVFPLSRPWEEFRADDAVPAPAETLPEIRSLPRIWTSHFQSYHPQTLRGMFQRARELRLEIVAEVTEGEEWRGVPVELEVQAGYWQVLLDAGGERRRFRLDDVRRARILLPEWL